MPELNAVVIQREDVAPGLMVIRVAAQGWTLPPFKAGQFAVLGLPASAPRSATSEPEDPGTPIQGGFLRRAYSIASSSLEQQYLEFYIIQVKSGGLTPRLFALKVGDPLWLGPKMTGAFTLDEVAGARNLVFIATGTGLAPYMSMLRTHLLDAPSSRKFAVIHGARHASDLGYREELFHMERDHAAFTYLPVITRPDPAWQGLTGRLQDFWATNPLERTWGRRPSPAGTDIFLCGNPGMVEALMKHLEAEGFREHTRKEPGQVHFEKYW